MIANKQDLLSKDWPEASQFKKSIRLEFTLYVSGIILLLMLMTGYVISSQYVKTTTQNVMEKLFVQARSYSGPAGKLIISTDGPDKLLLSNTCKKLADDNPDVYWAGIAGKNGVFLVHTDVKQVISSARMVPVKANRFRNVLRPDEGFELEKDTIYIAVPIQENGIRLGNLALAASTLPITRARTTAILTVASITIFMILIGIPITMLILNKKLRPIKVITEHLKSVNLNEISINIPLTSKNEFGYLAETIRVMGKKLNIAQKELIEKERISRELEIAREIQASILPKGYPHAPQFEAAGAYRSAKEVGGDYYDFIEFDEDHLGILVADVSGKSLPGMLVMLLTRDIVKRISRQIQKPAKLLSEVNRELLGNIKKGMFVTMFFGVLDKRRGTFDFASAGHNPLALFKEAKGKAELIKTRGFPLGLMPQELFEKRLESSKVNLQTNDWLIQYTDGINEAHNVFGEEFGLDRFTHLIESYKNLSPYELVDRLNRQHELFVGNALQYDDITLLAIKWKGQSVDITIEAS